jgi:hypothetical protein
MRASGLYAIGTSASSSPRADHEGQLWNFI